MFRPVTKGGAVQGRAFGMRIGDRIRCEVLSAERGAYGEQIVSRVEGWSVRTLRDRIDSMLYERTALSRKPEELAQMELASLRAKGQVGPALVLKDPYILDFLDLKDHYLERDLEDAILRELELFLLELGAGFTLVARRKRIQLDGDDFYIDLLFYNRKFKRLSRGTREKAARSFPWALSSARKRTPSKSRCSNSARLEFMWRVPYCRWMRADSSGFNGEKKTPRLFIEKSCDEGVHVALVVGFRGAPGLPYGNC